MTLEKKLHATAVGRIMTCEGRDLVGYLYEWNTGERQSAWFDQPVLDVIVEDFERDCVGLSQEV